MSSSAAAVLGEDAAIVSSRNSLTERILRELYGLYRDPTGLRARTHTGAQAARQHEFGRTGLVKMSVVAGMDPQLLPPRRRITVLIIGNHSAGKSSFINYYIEERVQQTGIAVETKGFTIIRSGREVQDVKGEGALLDNEHIAAVAERLGRDRQAFVDNLALVVRTSTAKDFANVDFIDTPGLLDGGVKYAFDVNNVIVELASIADLILVFLDPKGQALVSRTMDVVTSLNDRGYHEKMRYYLTQADTVARREDLHKVIVQVSQNLAPRVRYTQGLEIPCIWIPQADESGTANRALPGDANSLPKLIQDIRTTIGHKVQANMATCQADCKKVIAHIDAELLEEEKRRAIKRKWRWYQLLLVPWLMMLASLSFVDVLMEVEDYLPEHVRKADFMLAILKYTKPVVTAVKTVAGEVGVINLAQRLLVVAVGFLVVSVFYQFFSCRTRGLRTRTSAEMEVLRTYQASAEVMLKHVTDLYQVYVRAAQTPEYNPAAEGGAAATPQRH